MTFMILAWLIRGLSFTDLRKSLGGAGLGRRIRSYACNILFDISIRIQVEIWDSQLLT